MGMKNVLLLISLALLLSSCEDIITKEEQFERNFVVEALLVSGDNPDRIFISRLTESGERIGLEDLNVELIGPFGALPLISSGDGQYLNNDEIILASADYTINIRDSETDLRSSCTTPPNFELLNQVPQTITIDTSQAFEQVLGLNWSDAEEDVDYVLNLVFLGDESNEIDFNGVEGGQFADVFQNPQPESGTVLLASDFKYFGPHRLEIFAIYSDYSSLFNPFQLTDNDDVPYISNEFNDAAGYFTGITPLRIEFDVE
jgi:hypothetical protein